MTYADADQRVRTCATAAVSVKLILVALVINIRAATTHDPLRDSMLFLRATLRRRFLGVMIIALDWQARLAAVRANGVARKVFSVLPTEDYPSQVKDPHYTSSERRDVAQRVIEVARPQLPALRGLPDRPWAVRV